MPALDERDVKILEALRRDARKTFTDLASELNLPRTTVQERVRRLIEEGYIRSFTAIPDYSKIGSGTTAFVLVSFAPTMDVSQRELAAQIAKFPEVFEVHLVSGQWDMILKVRGSSVEDVGKLVIDRLRPLKNVARTETCFVFETVKEQP
ncbi:MAG: Lrp/AsnC family transcriptional regulator [Thaumarchaeota archaeon]|nr:Lrp/AsnC family transcriptional regulator [Candidatus Calditenuaceae archaeon]MCX8202878.1 Lrp/AsnC family transcriptional regulator [Nitrososphaeria archaeon]MDW8042647.1 Lrp/AsnC family transcriptional regulator [Nitrososphaerota archaeon]